jgi:hypothetical protein
MSTALAEPPATAAVEAPAEINVPPAENPFVRAFKEDTAAPVEKAPETPTESAPEALAESSGDATRQLFRKKAGSETQETAPESEIDKIKPPEKLSEANQTGWEALRGKAKTFEARVRELETEYPTLKEKAAAVEKLEAELKSREEALAQAKAHVERADAANSPEFRSKYVDGRAKIVSDVEALVKANEGDPADVAAALALKGAARMKALASVAESIPGFQQGILGNLLQQLDSLDTEAAAKLEKSGDYWKEVQAERAAKDQQAAEAFTKQSRVAFDAAKRRAAADIQVLQRVEGNDEWNARAETIIKDAEKAFFETDSLDTGAEMAILAKSAPVFRDMLVAEMDRSDGLEKKVADLEAELRKIHGGAPGATGRANGERPAAKMSFMERIQHEISS